MRDLGTRLAYACGIILTRELRHLLGIYLRISSSAIRGYAITTRSYFSERNSVSFPERYSKAEKGWVLISCAREVLW